MNASPPASSTTSADPISDAARRVGLDVYKVAGLKLQMRQSGTGR